MLRFRMDKIGILQFAILQSECIPQDYYLNTTLSFKTDQESQHAACIAKFEFRGKENELLLIIEVQCEFIIHPDDWKLLNKNEETVVIPKEILELFAVQTIGSTRGILFTKTEGTPYNMGNYILPPVNVHEIMQSEPEQIPEEIFNNKD